MRKYEITGVDVVDIQTYDNYSEITLVPPSGEATCLIAEGKDQVQVVNYEDPERLKDVRTKHERYCKYCGKGFRNTEEWYDHQMDCDRGKLSNRTDEEEIAGKTGEAVMYYGDDL